MSGEEEEEEDRLYAAICSCNVQTFVECLCSLDVNHVFVSSSEHKIHGMTLLRVAVLEGATCIARLLIERKCRVNSIGSCKQPLKSSLHETPLFIAVCASNVEIVRLLVQSGADVNAQDAAKCSALWHAVDTNNLDMVSAVLLAKDCILDEPDHFLISPLNVAVIHHNLDVVKRLLRKGARLDVQQIHGRTPLFTACLGGHKELALLLLKHGSDPNHIDRDGCTPLYFALDGPNTNFGIFSVLIDAGASLHAFSVPAFRLLHCPPDVVDELEHLLLNPLPLKILASLKIKEALRRRIGGRSIVRLITFLPLPTPILKFLLLNHLS